MSTLLAAVGGGQEPHAGVKRPLSNPTAVGQEQTVGRGAPMSPPNTAIKAPKLDHGNRQDRGTNTTIPYARVTALTVIDQTKGRLSPGDVLFLKKTPAGYIGSGPMQSKYRFGNGQDVMGMMCDPIGVDGLNRLLVGTLDKRRPWTEGVNLLKRTDPSLQLDLKELSVLREFVLDGVIISNEEPFSFTGGERDGAVFNVGIRGPCKTNNGYLSYESHSPTELYPRGFDTLAYQGAGRLGLERSGDTWHSYLSGSRAAISGMGGSDKGSGVDFVAAFTNSFTKYPTQMFDRKAKVLDRAYIALRQYNLYRDVVEPRAAYIGGVNAVNKQAKENAVIASMDLKKEDGTALTLAESADFYFFQYMPCTSRAFQTYLHNKQRDDGSKVVPGHHSSKRATGGDIAGVVYKDGKIGTSEFDAFRDEDVENCVGAWLVGTITDASSDRAGPFPGGPVSTTYRMTVNVGVKWIPRKYDIDNGGSMSFVEDMKDDMDTARTARFQDIGMRSKTSYERTYLGLQRTHTLAKMELHEVPHYYNKAGGGPPPPLTPAQQQAKNDFDAAKMALTAAKAAYDGPPISAAARPAYVAAANEMKAKADAYQLAVGGATADPLADQAVVDATAVIAAIPPLAPPQFTPAQQQQAKNDFDAAKVALAAVKQVFEDEKLDPFGASQGAVDDYRVAAAAMQTAADDYQATVGGPGADPAADAAVAEAAAELAASILPRVDTGARAGARAGAPSIPAARTVAPAPSSRPSAPTAPSSIVDSTIAARAASTAAVPATARPSSKTPAAPAAAASASSRPLVPTSTPAAAATTAATAARPTRAAAPKPTASGGIVDSVFSSMFGDLTSSAPAPAATSAAAAASNNSSTSTPPSPTHPSGGGGGGRAGGGGAGETGPRVFQRRAR